VSTLQFGISTHLYHNERLNRDHLVEIAAHGFEAVEIFANRPHLDCGDTGAGAEILETLRDTGLRAHAVHAPIATSLEGGTWGEPFSIASAGEPARVRAVEEVSSALRFAQAIGAAWVVVHVGVPESQRPPGGDNKTEAARRSLEAIGDLAAALGVGLALEIIPNRLSTAEALVRCIEDDFDAISGVGVCLDTGHAHLAGGLVDAIETASGHVVTTHVHDNGGRSDDHLVPFDGRIEWEAAMMALQKIGYEGPLVFELAGAAVPRQVLERAVQARARLERLLQP
jgi:sugar phosphate isomerase/epimerase